MIKQQTSTIHRHPLMKEDMMIEGAEAVMGLEGIVVVIEMEVNVIESISNNQIGILLQEKEVEVVARGVVLLGTAIEGGNIEGEDDLV